MVLLIGNYRSDQQQSMQRFAEMMLRELRALKVPAKLIHPQPFLTRLVSRRSAMAKWAGYFDKLILFPWQLRTGSLAGASVVHICDHSNAVYADHCGKLPIVVTCHDLLAVRGGLGEDTDCPASATGRFLQRWIFASLRRVQAIACVSAATAADAKRLLGEKNTSRVSVIQNALNYNYQPLAADEAVARLAPFQRLKPDRPFVLHVGSNLRRKNREGVLRIFAATKDQWEAQLVFAGDPLSAELCQQARVLGLSTRIVEIVSPDSKMLEALYSRAHALLFPSRFEGFGWPIIEAQACACPVLCSTSPPMPEVSGNAAMLRTVDDERGFAEDLLALRDGAIRAHYRELGLRNVARFQPRQMAERYVALYRTLGAAA